MRILFLTFFFGSYVFAHPVIYKGGWVYQGSFMPQMNEINMSYSASSRYSFVLNADHFENMNNYQDYAAGMNFLVKRWLAHDSQGNLYVGARGGYFKDDIDEGLTGHGFLMADWESREHYVMTRAKSYYFDNKERYSYLARYGFAPFIAGMDELQTWLIIQGLYFKQQSREVIITPMIRFFYKNVLWEVGYSTRGQSFLTLMVHY